MERVSKSWQRYHFPAACVSLHFADQLPIVHLGHEDFVDLRGHLLDYFVWERPKSDQSQESDLDSLLSSLDCG
jgi:hypothetical protein